MRSWHSGHRGDAEVVNDVLSETNTDKLHTCVRCLILIAALGLVSEMDQVAAECATAYKLDNALRAHKPAIFMTQRLLKQWFLKFRSAEQPASGVLA